MESQVQERSRELLRQDWERIYEAFRNDATVEGHVVKPIKGGFRVDVGRVRAFLPKSHIDWAPSEDGVGSHRLFRIIQIGVNRSMVLTTRPLPTERPMAMEVWYELIDAYRTKRAMLGTVLRVERDVLLDIPGVEVTLFHSELVEPECLPGISTGDTFEVMIMAITWDGPVS